MKRSGSDLVLSQAVLAARVPVAVVVVSGMVEDGASCLDDAIDDDRSSIVVTGAIKTAGACRGGGVGSPVRAL